MNENVRELVPEMPVTRKELFVLRVMVAAHASDVMQQLEGLAKAPDNVDGELRPLGNPEVGERAACNFKVVLRHYRDLYQKARKQGDVLTKRETDLAELYERVGVKEGLKYARE